MPTLNGLQTTKQQQRAPSQLREATVLDPPLTDEGWLRVELDDQEGVERVCPWQPRSDVEPEAGDAALVAESDAGNQWAIVWWAQSGQLPVSLAGAAWYTGAGAPAGGLGAVGDFYLSSTNGDYYVKTGASTWTVEGNLTGPTGATGATGSTGAAGTTGAAGATGPAGPGCLAGTLAARPSASSAGADALYFATDDQGGTLYRSDGATWTAVSVGASIPHARVYNSANLSISNGAWTALTFNSERYDNVPAGLTEQHSTSSNTSRLTCCVAGLYAVGANVRFAVNGTGNRGVRFIVNGTSTIAQEFRAPVTASDVTAVALSTEYRLAVNDYVEVQVWQNVSPTASLNVEAVGNLSPEFWWSWRSP